MMKYAGLTQSEVLERRRQFGENVLTEREKTPAWKKFLAKFTDPLIVILLVAGVLSIGISCYEYGWLHQSFSVFFEPLGIIIAILLATGLAFIFEQKAEKEFSILTLVNDEQRVKVVREGRLIEVSRREVVVDDVVSIGTGDEIPADGILLECTNLQVDESTLTGEPLCRKTTDPSQMNPDATYASNRVLRGTTVVEGHAYFKVDAVGDQTENGKVFREVQIDDSVKTPLNEQLSRLSKWISGVSFALAVLIVLAKVATYGHFGETFHLVDFLAYLLKAAMIAVTLIVVAVPEGLPMAVTLSLAYNMRRMLKSNNLVRRLHACETMGAVDVICTDKTGTLTQNRMKVAEMVDFSVHSQPDASLSSANEVSPTALSPDDEASPALIEAVVVNSTASLDGDHVIGNPTEGALLLWAREKDAACLELRNRVEVLNEVPFSTELKYMSTTVRSSLNGQVVTYTKGAPEIVLGMCQEIAGKWTRADITAWLQEKQQRGMRTLAFATDKTLVGMVAISDPVRVDVPAAICECREAGIQVKIITGDSQNTAEEIGRQIGVEAADIISRARPMDKKEMVEQLRSQHVVAVTGDGTNDAPALKAAHVGLSMGDGTAVAKEASDITILDNSFTSIVKAVMWGRSLYKNIQRFILFQMTVNVVACVVVLVGAFMGTENPLNVTQMLWVNLIMDTFAAMALASLPPMRDVMKEKPRRRRAFIIDRPMFANLLTTSVVFLVVLGWLLWYFKTHDLDGIEDFRYFFTPEHHNAQLHAYELTFFFTTFVMLQFWNLFNVRMHGTKIPFLRAFRKNGKGFTFVALLILVGQILIVNFGGEMFGVQPLDLLSWLVIAGATFVVNLLIFSINSFLRR